MIPLIDVVINVSGARTPVLSSSNALFDNTFTKVFVGAVAGKAFSIASGTISRSNLRFTAPKVAKAFSFKTIDVLATFYTGAAAPLIAKVGSYKVPNNLGVQFFSGARNARGSSTTLTWGINPAAWWAPSSGRFSFSAPRLVKAISAYKILEPSAAFSAINTAKASSSYILIGGGVASGTTGTVQTYQFWS